LLCKGRFLYWCILLSSGTTLGSEHWVPLTQKNALPQEPPLQQFHSKVSDMKPKLNRGAIGNVLRNIAKT
jgi:hypothetical protein